VKQKVKGIVAIGDGNIIGKDKTLPWSRVPEDMKYFYRKTRGCTVIIGRKTAEGLGDIFPLKERDNIVLSHKDEKVVRNTVNGEEYSVCSSWKEAFQRATEKTVWVCGGRRVYESGLRFIEEFHVSRISNNHFEQKIGCAYARWGFPQGDTWVLSSKKKKENVAIEIYRRKNGKYTESY